MRFREVPFWGPLVFECVSVLVEKALMVCFVVAGKLFVCSRTLGLMNNDATSL